MPYRLQPSTWVTTTANTTTFNTARFRIYTQRVRERLARLQEGVDDLESIVSYVQETRIQEAKNAKLMPRIRMSLSNELHELLYQNYYKSDIFRYMADNMYGLCTDNLDYVDVQRGMLSYLPNGRNHVQRPDGSWAADGRQTGKPARVLRMMLGSEVADTFSDSQYEHAVNLIKAADWQSHAMFQIVSGEDIRYWYDGEHYADPSGSLSTSCMRYDACQEYFDIYVQNPDVITMVILVNTRTQELMGRALLWHIPGFDTPILDRVYGLETMQNAFRAYADKQGWISRLHNTYQHPTEFWQDNKVVYLSVDLYLNNWRHKWYPYFDTFKYFNWTSGRFSNNCEQAFDFRLASTDGDGRPFNERKTDLDVPRQSSVIYLDHPISDRHALITVDNEDDDRPDLHWVDDEP